MKRSVSHAVAAAAVLTSAPIGASNVTTQHNDNQRTGANLAETTLNTSNVTVSRFGKLFVDTVDDQVYGQPLVVTGVTNIAGGTHDVVYVATVNNTVYAFDANTGGAPLWSKSFINGTNIVSPTRTDVGQGGLCGTNYQDFSGKLGIVGSMVIDASSGTLFVVSFTKENTTSFVHRLHALALNDGSEKLSGPVVIDAQVAGTGTGSANGQISFSNISKDQNQRMALSLANGTVYASFASFCDSNNYHGWMFGYSAATLARQFAFNTSPNNAQVGLWQGGGGAVHDSSGNAYVMTGNGSSANSEAFLKIGSGGSLAGSFRLSTFADLDNRDLDFGSAGPVFLPGTTLLYGQGKQGTAYILDTSTMTLKQSFMVTTAADVHHEHGQPVYWATPNNGPVVYQWAENEAMNAWKFNPSTLLFTTTALQTAPVQPPPGMPGAMLSLSANLSTAGTGVVWANVPLSGDANHATVPGVLRAFDASDVTHEIWNSEQKVSRDSFGNFAKYNYPTVVNGKVYEATFSGKLMVYGPLPMPNIPGQIEVEDFDGGWEGVGYHDLEAANQGGKYRGEGVDIEATGTPEAAGFDVGWTKAGEWLQYTANVNQTGNYTLTVRVASNGAGGTFHLQDVTASSNLTGPMTVNTTGGWQTFANLTKTISFSSVGTHVLRLMMDTNGATTNVGNFQWLKFDAVSSGTQSPYLGTPWAVPGQIEAENYDVGGEGVAYHDSDVGNTGGVLRTDDVDIQATGDTGGGANVGWTAAGEWLEYTVNVATTSAYTVGVRFASASTASNQLHVEIDGTNVTGAIAVNSTGGWQTWQTANVVTNASITAGSHVVRLFFDTGGVNLNWISFTASGGQTSFGNGGQPWSIPGKIEAENYDTGGQGVAFSDSDVGNNGNQYRTAAGDNVDIEVTADPAGGNFNVGWTAASEWVEYTANATTAGARTLSLRLAATTTGQTLRVEIDGVDMTGVVSIPNTGGWQTWTTVSIPNVNVAAGTHVIRVFFITGGCNFNWLSFT